MTLSIGESLRRPYDFMARYGGEEFAVLLPATDTTGGRQMAEKIRQGIENLAIENERGIKGILTVSIGVAALAPVDEDETQLLIEKADQALYEAKNKGRNQTRVSGDILTGESERTGE